MSEYMTHEEQTQLNELLAKAKRIQRAHKKEKDFCAWADERKDELLTRWQISVPNNDEEEEEEEDYF